MGLAENIADFIQQQEGWFPGSRSYRNNNPGNIWDDVIPGVKPKRIWPQYQIDSGGFLILPDYQTGYNLMLSQINIKMGRGESFSQLVNEWDSSDPASTRALYVSNGVAALGIDPDTPLNQLDSSGGIPGLPNPRVPRSSQRRRG
jgi:hypothetical protein